MIFVLVIIAAVVVYIILKGVAKGRSRMHHANMAGAMRDLGSTNTNKLPSWASRTAEIDVFRNGIVNAVHSRGVPRSYTQLALQRESPLYALVMNLAKNLEDRGSLFVEQQVGAADLVEAAWKRLPSSDQVKFVNML